MLATGAHIDRLRLERVLEALSNVPREEFVHPEASAFAYLPAPLDIGHGQTISHPQVVAAALYAADIQPSEHLLDVGTGCGYQAAVAAALARQVASIEVIADLARDAAVRLARLDIANIDLLIGDARTCAPENLQFDVILVAAGAEAVPSSLIRKLAIGGRLVMPVGAHDQQQLLLLHHRDADTLSSCTIGPARFVRFVGSPHPDDFVPETATSCVGESIMPALD